MLYAFENQKFAHLAQREFPAETCSDADLLAKVVSRNEWALRLLFQRHASLLRSIVGRVLNQESEIDDVLQDALAEIWKRADHYSAQKGQVIGWLVTLVRRRAIDRVRRNLTYVRARERYKQHLDAKMDDSDSGGVEVAAAASELHNVIAVLMKQLPASQREAIHLHVYHGLSQREVAARTGNPLGTVKTRIELAIKKLRRLLLARGTQDEWIHAATLS
jgi:RNA polymerase sigma-70 factor (ECF subfamily)